MNKTRKQAWKECLRLWKRLSEMPDQKREVSFKTKVLVELGIGERIGGCPFCDKYYGEKDCPIGDCSKPKDPCCKTPYEQWAENPHSQQHAKAFYEYLLKLYRKEIGR